MTTVATVTTMTTSDGENVDHGVDYGEGDDTETETITEPKLK